MNGSAVLENVRRYRAIASLYRQTAAFRPLQSCSLLGQAERWEQFAIAEIEAYFTACHGLDQAEALHTAPSLGSTWGAMAIVA